MNTVSFWGVDHGDEIAKSKDNKSSFGRNALAATVPGAHAAVAGKKGKKLRAFGNAQAGSLGGVVGGSLAGAAVGRGNPTLATLGAYGGAAAGGVAGMKRAQRKGYLKPDKGLE